MAGVITVKIEGLDKTITGMEIAFGKKAIAAKVRQGMRNAKPEVKKVLGQEMRKAFKVNKPQFADKTWRISTDNSAMTIRSLVRWLSSQGGSTINARGKALLIPINTYLGARIGTKKFYKLVDWLRQNKLSVIKDGVLYANPVWNTSKRGGVGVGTRINKKFRATIQGSIKRPSGFSVSPAFMRADRLIPIAIIRRNIRMPKRFSLTDIASQSLTTIVAKHIKAELFK